MQPYWRTHHCNNLLYYGTACLLLLPATAADPLASAGSLQGLELYPEGLRKV
jgi:hypothetical protein